MFLHQQQYKTKTLLLVLLLFFIHILYTYMTILFIQTSIHRHFTNPIHLLSSSYILYIHFILNIYETTNHSSHTSSRARFLQNTQTHTYTPINRHIIHTCKRNVKYFFKFFFLQLYFIVVASLLTDWLLLLLFNFTVRKQQQQQKQSEERCLKNDHTTNEQNNYHDYHKYSLINLFFMCCTLSLYSLHFFVLYCGLQKLHFFPLFFFLFDTFSLTYRTQEHNTERRETIITIKKNTNIENKKKNRKSI